MGKQRHIYHTKEERAELVQLVRSGVNSARVIDRPRTLLLLDRSQGQADAIAEVVDAAMMSQGAISNIKKRCVAGRLEHAPYDLPRPGAKPKHG
jgi:hypothetical protein